VERSHPGSVSVFIGRTVILRNPFSAQRRFEAAISKSESKLWGDKFDFSLEILIRTDSDFPVRRSAVIFRSTLNRIGYEKWFRSSPILSSSSHRNCPDLPDSSLPVLSSLYPGASATTIRRPWESSEIGTLTGIHTRLVSSLRGHSEHSGSTYFVSVDVSFPKEIFAFFPSVLVPIVHLPYACIDNDLGARETW